LNQKEKEVIEAFLDIENQGIFNIEPFLKLNTMKNEKAKKSLGLPQNLLKFLNELANFLEKGFYFSSFKEKNTNNLFRKCKSS